MESEHASLTNHQCKIIKHPHKQNNLNGTTKEHNEGTLQLHSCMTYLVFSSSQPIKHADTYICNHSVMQLLKQLCTMFAFMYLHHCGCALSPSVNNLINN